MAFDSKNIRRGNFRALIGIAVTISDLDNFEKMYTAILQDYFNSLNYPFNRNVYKSADLLSLFYSLDPDVILNIVSKLCAHIDHIDLFYSYFAHSDTAKRPIDMYYNHTGEKVSHDRYLDKIENYYPALCCYSMIVNLTTDVTDKYLLDGCSDMEPSKATKAIYKNSKVVFFTNGDRVNCAISAADLILKFIDVYIAKKDYYLNQDLPSKLPPFINNKITCNNRSDKWVYDFNPESNSKLDITRRLARPIHFVLRNLNSTIIKNEATFKKTPIFDTALNMAQKNVGSVKLFDADDIPKIQESDYIIYYDAATEKMVEELKEHGVKATFLDFRK